METSDLIRIIFILILLFLSGFFSSSETALTAVNKIRIRALHEEGVKNAGTVLKLLDEQQRLLSALLIGNNIVNTVLTALVTVTVTEIFGSFYVGAATAIVTIAIILCGEITPKTFAAAHAEEFSLKVAEAVFCWMKIITPLSRVLDLIVKGIVKLSGVDTETREGFTESEIRYIVDESHEEGEIEAEEKEMINNVFDLGDSVAKDVMIPRAHMVFLPIDSNYEETMLIFRNSLFTRLPVYEGDSFHVIGILNVKDILIDEDPSGFSVRKLMREPFFTHEFKKTSELMKEMLSNGVSMTIVLDEYGDTSGLLTIEDLLEEIVGEIRDEYDEEERELIRKIDERTFVADGSMSLSDLSDKVPGIHLTSDEFDSIGGVVIGLLDRLPDDGDEVLTESGIRLKVRGVDHNHIDKVEILLPEEEEKQEAADSKGEELS